MRNNIAMATVIADAAAMWTTARTRPSRGASSTANRSRKELRRARELTSAAMTHFDRCRHAHVHRLGRGITESHPDRESLCHHHPVEIATDLGQVGTVLIG